MDNSSEYKKKLLDGNDNHSMKASQHGISWSIESAHTPCMLNWNVPGHRAQKGIDDLITYYLIMKKIIVERCLDHIKKYFLQHATRNLNGILDIEHKFSKGKSYKSYMQHFCHI